MIQHKKAFTMIELIFVIVIIGILASVAIPRLAATRTDAMVSAAMANLTTCVKNIGNAYTAQRTVNMGANQSCIDTSRCFTIVDVFGNGMISVISDALGRVDENEAYCIAARQLAVTKGMAAPAGAGGKEYHFGSNKVVY